MIWVWLVAALAVGLVAILLAVASRAAIREIRRRRVPRRIAKPLPVVLAHGILGFDELGLGPARVSYFRGIVQRLESQGAQVICARVPPLAPIHVRAERLAEIIRSAVQSFGAPRVNLVAHSMGGLDARYAISRLGLGDRVASLITIGTPHHGTPIADFGADLLRRLKLDSALLPLFDVQALRDLTTTRMHAFNREVRNVPDVRYLSIVARATRVHPLLTLAHGFLRRTAGENDGLVPARSQRWGTVLREIEADHWSQIGWSGGFDAITLYDEILQELRALGL
jgi:triacylglycerol lipase